MGCPVLIPSAADSLIHVCVHASYCSSRHSLRWISDAWFILDRNIDLDWDYLVGWGVRGRMALPLWITLSYLAQELDAPVPAAVLENLRSAAANTKRIGRQLALLGTKAETLDHVEKLAHITGGLRGHLVLAREGLSQWLTNQRWINEIRFSWQRILRFIHRVVTPTAKDRAILSLPDSLLFLYYLLRPIRLIRENGLKGVVKDLPKFLRKVRD
jgi:hypothetical protein